MGGDGVLEEPLSRDTGVGDDEDASNADQPECQPHQRADARRNRLQILHSGRDVLRRAGHRVPIDDIARLACVGVGTVYRHFPTKEALVEAVIIAHVWGISLPRLEHLPRVMTRRMLSSPSWPVWPRRARRSGTLDALAGAGVDLKLKMTPLKDEMAQAMGVLLHRAQATGDVRSDTNWRTSSHS